MPGAEIISLQLGHFANHVGTHYWNLQEASFCYDESNDASNREAANHDILFREGLNLRGQVTFTPRLLAIDLKGSLKSLKAQGNLYEESMLSAAQGVGWESNVSLHATDPAPRNQFLLEAFGGDDAAQDSGDKSDDEVEEKEQRRKKFTAPTAAAAASDEADQSLERSVHVWSDFLGVHLHPRSVLLTPGHWHSHDQQQQQQFSQWEMGLQLWQDAEFADEVETRVRQFAEECDLMQGFHCLHDSLDGFSGLTSCVLGHLREEFPKKTVLALPCFPQISSEISAEQAAMQQLNCLLSAVALESLADITAPLATCQSPWQRQPKQARSYWPLHPHLSLAYHSSAVLAAWLDTQSLSWRQLAGPRLWDAQQLLCCEQRRICCPSLRLPFQLLPNASLYASLNRDATLQPVGPFTSSSSSSPANFLAALSVSRGVPTARIVDVTVEREAAFQLRGSKVTDVFNQLLQDTCPGAVSRHVAFQQPIKLTRPFPAIFDAGVGAPLGEWRSCSKEADGDASAAAHLPGSVSAWSLMENCNAPADGLGEIGDCGERLLRTGQLPVIAGSVESEEVREALHSLSVMRDRYTISL